MSVSLSAALGPTVSLIGATAPGVSLVAEIPCQSSQMLSASVPAPISLSVGTASSGGGGGSFLSSDSGQELSIGSDGGTYYGGPENPVDILKAIAALDGAIT